MLQRARLTVEWTTLDVLRMVGALVTTRKRSRRPSAMDLAAFDTWWHVWDEVL